MVFDCFSFMQEDVIEEEVKVESREERNGFIL